MLKIPGKIHHFFLIVNWECHGLTTNCTFVLFEIANGSKDHFECLELFTDSFLFELIFMTLSFSVLFVLCNKVQAICRILFFILPH